MEELYWGASEIPAGPPAEASPSFGLVPGWGGILAEEMDSPFIFSSDNLDPGSTQKLLMKTGLILIVIGHLNFITGALVHGMVLRHIANPQDSISLNYAISNVIMVTSAILVGVPLHWLPDLGGFPESPGQRTCSQEPPVSSMGQNQWAAGWEVSPQGQVLAPAPGCSGCSPPAFRDVFELPLFRTSPTAPSA